MSPKLLDLLQRYSVFIPRFDIFAGSPNKRARWLEATLDLANARKRMEELARQEPGEYFVFSTFNHAILARIDTAKNLMHSGAPGRVEDVA
jgi:hypothetical protein